MKIFGWFTKIIFFLLLFICKLLVESVKKSSPYFILFSQWKRRQKNVSHSALFIIWILLHILLMPHQNFAFDNKYGRRSITTPFGIVRGETVVLASDEDLSAVTQYLGIPYGVAPSGQVY